MLRLAVVTSYFPIRAQPHRGHSAYQTLREMTSDGDSGFCPLATYPLRLLPHNFHYVRADPSFSPPDIPAHYIDYPALPLLSQPLTAWSPLGMCCHTLSGSGPI